MKNITLWTTLAFFIIAFPAQAQEEFQFTGYIGAGFGMSRLDPDTNNTGFSVDDTNDFGYKIIAGYDWTPRISTELYYADLGEATIKPSGQVSYQDFGISRGMQFGIQRAQGLPQPIEYRNIADLDEKLLKMAEAKPPIDLHGLLF